MYIFSMKIDAKIYIPFAILIGALLLSICSFCFTVSPYQKHNLFSREFPYEGFAGLGYAEYNKPTPSKTPSQTPSAKNTEAKKVEGFQGLQSSAIGAESAIDIFSKSTGSATCVASGYTNSTGNLCLDKTQLGLLTTRGGNASGNPDKIGK